MNLWQRFKAGRGERYVSRYVGVHLSISLVRNFLLGLFLWVFIHQLQASPSIHRVVTTTGVLFPAGLLMLSGFLGLLAWICNNTMYARVGIFIGAIVMVALITSYFVSLVYGDPQTGNWLVVLLSSIVAHDFALLSQAFIDPSKIATFTSDERTR